MDDICAAHLSTLFGYPHSIWGKVEIVALVITCFSLVMLDLLFIQGQIFSSALWQFLDWPKLNRGPLVERHCPIFNLNSDKRVSSAAGVSHSRTPKEMEKTRTESSYQITWPNYLCQSPAANCTSAVGIQHTHTHTHTYTSLPFTDVSSKACSHCCLLPTLSDYATIFTEYPCGVVEAHVPYSGVPCLNLGRQIDVPNPGSVVVLYYPPK